MAVAKLRLLGIGTEGSNIDRHGHGTVLRLATEGGGAIRSVPLTEEQLIELIRDGAQQLDRMRKVREGNAR